MNTPTQERNRINRGIAIEKAQAEFVRWNTPPVNAAMQAVRDQIDAQADVLSAQLDRQVAQAKEHRINRAIAEAQAALRAWHGSEAA